MSGPFNRPMLANGTDVSTKQGPASGFCANPGPVNLTATGAFTLTQAQIAGGMCRVSGLSAAANITTPTAVEILALCPDMDVGDSFMILFSNLTANAGTWVAGTGVTLVGRTTLPASATLQAVIVNKTSATTVAWVAS